MKFEPAQERETGLLFEYTKPLSQEQLGGP